jgi:hypothetical protein
MNTFATVELAHHEQEARVRHAMHVRAVKAYQREHPIQHHRRAGVATLLRRLAARVEGRATAAPTPCVTAPVRQFSTR